MVRSGVWALAAAIGWAAPAAAELAGWDTYLRTGPGPQYAAVDELRAGTVIAVRGCDGGWCRVAFGDTEGFVPAFVVSAEHAAPAVTADPAPCFDTRREGHGGGEKLKFCGR